MRQRKWNIDNFVKAVNGSTSMRQVLVKIGLKDAGGNYLQVKKYIKELNLDTKHFKGHAWNKGLTGIRRSNVPLDQVLVKGKYFQTFALKRRLFIAGLKPRYCEQCNWAEKTTDGYLPLELDHINGDRYDNRLENLRVLCPNCHSLTPTHRGRSGRGKKKIT